MRSSMHSTVLHSTLLFGHSSIILPLFHVAFLHRFNFPHEASGSPSNLYYSFDYGWVHFVTFNADGPATKDFNFPTFPPAEIQWLKEDLGTSCLTYLPR